jgi:hypothetical protein
MTDMVHTHSTAVKVDVFDDEFKPIMKAVKYALMSDEGKHVISGNEWSILNNWLDYFSDVARNEGI